MKSPFWNNPKLRRRLLAVLTTLLVLSLAMHPELRLLVPLLDATGIDVLVTLLGLQALSMLSDSLLPYLRLIRRELLPRVLAIGCAIVAIPGMRTISTLCSNLLFYGSGHLGQFVWIKSWTLWQWALVPDNSSKPNPLRVSAQVRR